MKKKTNSKTMKWKTIKAYLRTSYSSIDLLFKPKHHQIEPKIKKKSVFIFTINSSQILKMKEKNNT